jgi:hypothetical protein
MLRAQSAHGSGKRAPLWRLPVVKECDQLRFDRIHRETVRGTFRHVAVSEGRIGSEMGGHGRHFFDLVESCGGGTTWSRLLTAHDIARKSAKWDRLPPTKKPVGLRNDSWLQVLTKFVAVSQIRASCALFPPLLNDAGGILETGGKVGFYGAKTFDSTLGEILARHYPGATIRNVERDIPSVAHIRQYATDVDRNYDLMFIAAPALEDIPGLAAIASELLARNGVVRIIPLRERTIEPFMDHLERSGLVYRLYRHTSVPLAMDPSTVWPFQLLTAYRPTTPVLS